MEPLQFQMSLSLELSRTDFSKADDHHRPDPPDIVAFLEAFIILTGVYDNMKADWKYWGGRNMLTEKIASTAFSANSIAPRESYSFWMTDRLSEAETTGTAAGGQ